MQDSVGLDLKLTSYLFYLLVIVSSNLGKKALEKLLSLKTSSGSSSTSGGSVFLIPSSITSRTSKSLSGLPKGLAFVSKTQINASCFFTWAKLTTLTDRAHKKLDVQADTIKKALEVGYSVTEWESAARRPFDILRKDQCGALVVYLVVEPSLVATGTITVTDADSLFE